LTRATPWIYNVITMKTSIVAIGNSKGIRLPKVLLEESGIVKEVEIKVVKGGLRITPIKPPKSTTSEPAVLSEKALAKDWDRPEEDRAWANL
jgi:antitoxin component of MazEF toxin-antitoxin module